MERADVPRATTIVCVVAATALGLGLRLAGLGRDGFWHDELGTHKYIAFSVGDLAGGAALDPGHPPLYYLLLRLLCGPDASDWALRLVSAIAGAATIPVAALLAVALFGRRAAVAAALLVAASPFLITHSQEARMYALLALLSTAASLFAWRTLRHETPRAALAYAVLATVTVLTHFLGAAACIAHVIAAPSAARSRRGLLLFLGAATLGATTFLLLWGWHIPHQLARDPLGWCEASSWSARARTLAQALIGGQNVPWRTGQPAAAVASAVVVTLGALVGCAIVAVRRRRLAREATFAVLLVLVPVGGVLVADLAIHPAFVARYLTAGVVPLLIIIAAGAVTITRARSFVVAGLLCAELGAHSLQRTGPSLEHWREAGAFVSARLQEGDVVFTATPNFSRYLPPGTRITTPWKDWTGSAIDPDTDTGERASRGWVIWEKYLDASLEQRGLALAGNPLLRERFFGTEVVLLQAPSLRRAAAAAGGSPR